MVTVFFFVLLTVLRVHADCNGLACFKSVWVLLTVTALHITRLTMFELLPVSQSDYKVRIGETAFIVSLESRKSWSNYSRI